MTNWLRAIFVSARAVFHYQPQKGFLGGLAVKNTPINARDMGSSPGSGRYPGKEMAIFSSILAWRIPWIEEPGRLQSIGSRRVDRIE